MTAAVRKMCVHERARARADRKTHGGCARALTQCKARRLSRPARSGCRRASTTSRARASERAMGNDLTPEIVHATRAMAARARAHIHRLPTSAPPSPPALCGLTNGDVQQWRRRRRQRRRRRAGTLEDMAQQTRFDERASQPTSERASRRAPTKTIKKKKNCAQACAFQRSTARKFELSSRTVDGKTRASVSGDEARRVRVLPVLTSSDRRA